MKPSADLSGIPSSAGRTPAATSLSASTGSIAAGGPGPAAGLPPPVDLAEIGKWSSPYGRYHGRNVWWRSIRIPWTLHRYICFEILRICWVSVFAVSLLCSTVVAYQTVRSGIQLSYIWPFLAKTFAYPLFFSLPVGLLAGVTLTKGRMVAELEIDAVRCHGGSHLQLIFPVLLLGALATCAGFWFNGWVMPELRYEKRNLQQYILRQIENLGSGSNRTILLPEGGGSLFVERYEGLELHRVQIDLHRELQSRFVPDVREQLPDRLPEKITLLALSGRIEITENRRGINLHLRSVEVLFPEKIKGSRTGNNRFIQKLSISENVSIPLSFERRNRSLKDLRDPDLSERIADIDERLFDRPDDLELRHALTEARAERHRRLAFSLSGFAFPCFGLAVCFFLHARSRLLPFFVACAGVLAIFYPLLAVGSYLADQGLYPLLAYALPNVALLGLTAWLARRVFRR